MTIWSPNLETPSRISGTAQPLYRALADALALDISNGSLKPGDRLPTQRKLAKQLGVTVGTIGRAYSVAEKRGLISLEVGRGSFVLAGTEVQASNHHDDPSAPNSLRWIDLGMSVPPRAQESRLYSQTLARLAKRTEASRLFWRYPLEPAERHRATLAHFLKPRFPASPGELFLCGGTQTGLLATFSTLEARRVLVEEVTFPGLLAAAALLQLELVPVAMDDKGLCADSLRRVARRGDVLYCIPTQHNPTGITMPAARRREIAEVARTKSLKILEDDVYGLWARQAPATLTSMLPDQCFLLSSLSKTLGSGFRLAILRAPKRFRTKLLRRLRALDCFLPALTVEIACLWMDEGAVPGIIRERRRTLESRWRLAEAVLELGTTNKECNHLWLHLPETLRAETFEQVAELNRVQIHAGSRFAPDPERAPNTVRISLGAAETEADLLEGLGRLKTILDHSRAERSATVQY